MRVDLSYFFLVQKDRQMAFEVESGRIAETFVENFAPFPLERVLIRTLPFCMRCSTGADKTVDHMFAKYLFTRHSNVLAGVVFSSKNEAPFCWSDHQWVERRKLKRYQEKGLAGVVLYVAKDYPRSPNEYIKELHEAQIADLLRRIAVNIDSLNGDIKKPSRDDYKRAQDIALEYSGALLLTA